MQLSNLKTLIGIIFLETKAYKITNKQCGSQKSYKYFNMNGILQNFFVAKKPNNKPYLLNIKQLMKINLFFRVLLLQKENFNLNSYLHLYLDLFYHSWNFHLKQTPLNFAKLSQKHPYLNEK